ncbi:sensor histidine kinase [Corynebacterium liangguodongii]|nr:histidine kinase [Corynebacterium liangguodongii]
MAASPTHSSASYFLRFLDYFCVLFAVLTTTPQYPLVEAWVLVASIAAFTAAWFVWRAWPCRASSVCTAALSLVVLAVSNSPVVVLALWLGFVALARTLGDRSARAFAPLPVAVTVVAQLVLHSPPWHVLTEFAAMVVVAASGVALGRTVTASFDAEARLRRSLRDSRELALSKERERIAAGLHNGLGHLLTSIGLSIDFASRVVEAEPARAKEELRVARERTTEALDAMRKTVRAVSPPLVDAPFGATVEGLAARFDRTGLTVKVTGARDAGWDAGWDEERTTLALVFVQEALTNIVRHSGATRVHISVAPGGVSVEDDGTGNASEASFGISSLRRRASQVGARLITEPHGGIAGGFRISLDFEGERR